MVVARGNCFDINLNSICFSEKKKVISPPVYASESCGNLIINQLLWQIQGRFLTPLRSPSAWGPGVCVSVKFFGDSGTQCLKTTSINNSSSRKQDQLCSLSEALGAACLFPLLALKRWSCLYRHCNHSLWLAPSCIRPRASPGKRTTEFSNEWETWADWADLCVLSSLNLQVYPVATFGHYLQ